MQRKTRIWAVRYLIFQTLAAAAWWAAMLLLPEWRAWFFVLPTSEMSWMSFLLPDLVFYIGVGWIAAVGLRHEHRWAWSVLVLHVGGVGYAALQGLAGSLISSAGWPGTWLMLASFGITGWLMRRLKPY